jgi:hypothetical protein
MERLLRGGGIAVADQIQVVSGAPPWQPTPDSEVVAEYAYHDFPTVGVVRQHGIDYLFRCIAGADEDVSAWFYVLISGDERELLESAPTPEDFERLLEQIPMHHPAVFALAADGVGIFARQATAWYDEASARAALARLADQAQELARQAEDLAASA